MKSMDLVKAIGNAKDADILSAHEPVSAGCSRSKIGRMILIAAVLTALLTMTAAALTLLSRAQRMADMPDDPYGETRAAEIRNGVKGSPTYLGTAEWLAFQAQWMDSHSSASINYDLEFTKGDLDYYKTCGLYSAYDEEQAKKLYEIADKYDLKLYRDVIAVDEIDNGKRFYELSGCKPFTENLTDQRFSGYVFEDGSFKLEQDYVIKGETVQTVLNCIHSGSIYPFGGADTDDTVHREEEYVTAKGQRVLLDLPVDSPYPDRAIICYASPDGEIWVEASIYNFYSEEETDYIQQAKDLADSIDFEAMHASAGKAGEILNQKTAAEDNPEIVKKLEEIRSSDAILAAYEFRNFYLNCPEFDLSYACYHGVYDEEGHPILSQKLRELAETYGLTYATSTTTGNEFYDNAVVYDNGVWTVEFPFDRFESMAALHFIPKTALYTGWYPPQKISEYREVWEYKTSDGTTLLCYCSGPDLCDGSIGSGAVLETEDGWLWLQSSNSPYTMMEVADMVDWAKIGG